jgi:hypothetical protein
LIHDPNVYRVVCGQKTPQLPQTYFAIFFPEF